MNENEHWLELIQAELDGELSGPQRAELHRALLADPALRALRDELAATCRALDAIEPEPVPTGLHESIMAALPVVPNAARQPPQSRAHAPMLRIAAAFVGGALVTALAFQFGGLLSGHGSGQLSGTIATASVDPSRMDVRTPLMRGSIVLDRTGDILVVRARLASSRPVTVVARLAGEEARLTGFAGDGAPSNERSAGFSLPAGAGPASIDVELLDATSGAVLHRGTLRPGDGS
jgi:anti-sigma factor RsiW